MAESSQQIPGGDPVVIRFGDHELVIRRRYEAISIVNDILIGVWFVVGSVLFFSPDTTRAGTWLFLLGSVQLLIRPLIRLARNLHLQRVTATPTGGWHSSSHDF